MLRGTFTVTNGNELPAVQTLISRQAPGSAEGYCLKITSKGIEILCREPGGFRMARATLRQLRAQYGSKLPCLIIRDWPDFPRRGVMLDISRGRVPKLQTLLDLAEKLAAFKINELQLYTEHTFAYRRYKSVWQSWGALTAQEIRTLDRHCRRLGIDLVPNQNSFGHLRYFLTDRRLKKLAEISRPYEADTRDFLRRPTTLAPNHPGALPFLRGLYDELLPNFSSRFFNVGCDETWDLGKGRSQKLCAQKGQGRVYADFLTKIQREVSTRGKTMMFWGDIILKYPGLIRELPKGIIALNWGYEADHPFAKETAQFANAKIPFYVCPGTATWQTLIGKHDNAIANLKSAAQAGKKSGAIGYLITDWGDGGHPQPLAVSWPMFAAGAALAWNAKTFSANNLAQVISREVFKDGTGKMANAALKLGLAHSKLGVKAVNETPLGTVIAAPKPADRELFCRNGLKWFAKIPASKIRAAMAEIDKQRAFLRGGASATSRHRSKSKSTVHDHQTAAAELELAARMAMESCYFMLWQQSVAGGKKAEAKQLARRGIRELAKLERDFNRFWPRRNQATPKHCAPFLRWRMEDYRRGFVA